MLMMQMLVSGPKIPQRYDEQLSRRDHFDVSVRAQPKNIDEIASCYNIHVDDLLDANPHAQRGIDGLRIAEASLVARNMVGLVIGSLAQDTDGLAGDETLERHRDIDVLILSPFSRKHPAPMEGGIDWWVRPPQKNCTLPRPTNGNVGLWFDIALRDDVSIMGRTQSRLLDGTTSITKIQQNAAIPAGLYRPSVKTMERMVDHATRCGQFLHTTYQMGEEAIDLWNERQDASLRRLLTAAQRIEDIFRDVAWQVQSAFTSRTVREARRCSKPLLQAGYALADQRRDSERIIKKFARDYSYLLLRDCTKDALLPTLPDHLVQFTPLVHA